MSKSIVPDPRRDMAPELAEAREGLRLMRRSLAAACDDLAAQRELAQVRTKAGRAALLELRAEQERLRKAMRGE